MLLYSLLFAVFWGLIMWGIEVEPASEYKKRLAGVFLPLITDIVLVVFWGLYLFGPAIQTESEDASGLMTLALVATVGIVLEVGQIYKQPTLERLETVGAFFRT